MGLERVYRRRPFATQRSFPRHGQLGSRTNVQRVAAAAGDRMRMDHPPSLVLELKPEV
jgi:hypothetical protein